jgi:hypothetical protein
MLAFRICHTLLTLNALNLFFSDKDILHVDGLMTDTSITTPQAIYRSIDISKNL